MQDIRLLNTVYEDVPAVELPKEGGGTARFDDTSDANATASDIVSGKTAYVNGSKLTGTHVLPTGTLSITSNDTYDVTNYASADVNVSGSISVGWATSVEIVTIGANSVTNSQGVKDYFASAGYSFNICILLDNFTVNNQFVWSVNHTKDFAAQIVRWRNNSLGVAKINAGYDCYIVEGTRYLLIGH